VIRLNRALASFALLITCASCAAPKPTAVATAPPSSPSPKPVTLPTPPWFIFRAGQRAILEDSWDDSPSPVCSSPQTWQIYDWKDEKACPKIGSRKVTIIATAAYVRKLKGEPPHSDPLARVADASGAVLGWTDAIHLMPVIPVGAALTVRRVDGGIHEPQMHATIAELRHSSNGLSVGEDANAVLVRQQGAFLLVKLASGKRSGSTGWVTTSDTTARGGRVFLESFWETTFVSGR